MRAAGAGERQGRFQGAGGPQIAPARLFAAKNKTNSTGSDRMQTGTRNNSHQAEIERFMMRISEVYMGTSKANSIPPYGRKVAQRTTPLFLTAS
jgi:hypothetical protein